MTNCCEPTGGQDLASKPFVFGPEVVSYKHIDLLFIQPLLGNLALTCFSSSGVILRTSGLDIFCACYWWKLICESASTAWHTGSLSVSAHAHIYKYTKPTQVWTNHTAVHSVFIIGKVMSLHWMHYDCEHMFTNYFLESHYSLHFGILIYVE